MFVAFDCARCGRSLRVLGCHEGRTVRCPGCNAALIVRETYSEPSSAFVGTDLRDRRKVHAVPCVCDNSFERSDGEHRPDAPPLSKGSRSRSSRVWLLFAPAFLALGLPLWAGYGVFRSHTVLSLSAADAKPSLTIPTTDDEPQHSLTAPQTTATVFPRGLLPFSTVEPPNPDLQFVAQVGELLAATAAPNARGGGVAFVTTASGVLKLFSYPNFHELDTVPLEQPAYRIVADGARGLLWVAASDPGSLRVNGVGDRPRGRGDFHLYDFNFADAKPHSRLRPRHVLPLQGDVIEFLASPDGRWLFYLAETDRGVHLGRIDADRQAFDAELPLPLETRALCQTPDGSTLYAAGGAMVFAIDPATLRLRRRVELNADIHTVAADNDGQVYLGEQGQWTNLTKLDLSGSTPSVRKWNPDFHGRIYLRLAPKQDRLYVGTSSIISHHLDALLVQGNNWNQPRQAGMVVSDSNGPVRGEFFLTPDGRFLLNRWGKVYRLIGGG